MTKTTRARYTLEWCLKRLGNAVPELRLHPLRGALDLRLLRCLLFSRVLLVWRRRNGAQCATQAVVTNDLLHPQNARRQ